MPVVSCVVSFVLLTGVSAKAQDYTSLLDSLNAEIIAELSALPENLTKEQKKQKAALLKAAAALSKPPATLAADLKDFGKVAALLQKAFPVSQNRGWWVWTIWTEWTRWTAQVNRDNCPSPAEIGQDG